MIKKTITYTDYYGDERTEDFWFHLNERELANLVLKSEGGFEGFEGKLRQMVSITDIPKLVELFESIVLESYGVPSEDGKRFIKENGKLANEFVETEAYSKLFMEFISNPDEIVNFINGIVPKSISDEMNSEDAKNKIEDLKKEYHIEQ